MIGAADSTGTGGDMRSVRAQDSEFFLDPHSAEWNGIPAESVQLVPTPLPLQPNPYIRKSWQNKPYGVVQHLEVASVHDGRVWVLRAAWNGVSPEGSDFPDALAVALPVRGNPPLSLMGSPEMPIHFLRWQSKSNSVASMLGTGIGTSTKPLDTPALGCKARGIAANGLWTVTVARRLGVWEDVAPLVAGSRSRIGFAVWNGANDERAGIKSWSVDWIELRLDR